MQTLTAADYLSNFRNNVLIILNTRTSKKWEKYVSDIDHTKTIEFYNSSCIEFEKATKIAIRVEGAFVGIFSIPNLIDIIPTRLLL